MEEGKRRKKRWRGKESNREIMKERKGKGREKKEEQVRRKKKNNEENKR